MQAEGLTSIAAEETPEPKSASRKRSSSGAAAARRSGASRASLEAKAGTSLVAEETPEPKSASRRGRPSRAPVDQEASGLAAETCSGDVRRSSSVAAASATFTPHTEGRVQMKSAGRKSSLAAAAVQEPDAADARCSAKRWSSAGSWRSTAEALEEPELVGQEESAAKKHNSSSSITRKSSSATRASETSFSTTTPRSSPRTRTTAAPAPTQHKVASSKKKTATPKNKAIKHTFKKGKPNWDKIHARQFAKMKTIAPKQTKTLGKHFSKVKCRGTFTIQYKVTITRSSLFFFEKKSLFLRFF